MVNVEWHDDLDEGESRLCEISGDDEDDEEKEKYEKEEAEQRISGRKAGVRAEEK